MIERLTQDLRGRFYALLERRDEFGRRAFTMDPQAPRASAAAEQAAAQIRGAERPPVLFILGVMPRSGSVFLGRLLALHPMFHMHPNELWEVPVFETTRHLLAYQKAFFNGYPPNRDKMGEHDLLALHGSAFVGYLHSFVAPERRAIVKETSVKYLNYFTAQFPHEQLLLLMRDGRDLVHSTLKTWPHRRFTEVCRLWRDSATTVMDFHQREQAGGRVQLLHYEDVLNDQAGAVRQICDHLGVPLDDYPFDQIDAIPAVGASSLAGGDKVHWRGVEKPDGFRPTGHWEAWSAKEKAQFKQIAGETLIRAGYASDLNW